MRVVPLRALVRPAFRPPLGNQHGLLNTGLYCSGGRNVMKKTRRKKKIIYFSFTYLKEIIKWTKRRRRRLCRRFRLLLDTFERKKTSHVLFALPGAFLRDGPVDNGHVLGDGHFSHSHHTLFTDTSFVSLILCLSPFPRGRIVKMRKE